jgi:vacuolar-type H+-ATPase subunit H
MNNFDLMVRPIATEALEATDESLSVEPTEVTEASAEGRSPVAAEGPAPFEGPSLRPVRDEAPTKAMARLLELAAQNADQLESEARAEAEETVSAARAEAERLLAEARSEADRVRSESQEQQSQGEQEIERLRRTAEEHREAMRSHVEELMAKVESAGIS